MIEMAGLKWPLNLKIFFQKKFFQNQLKGNISEENGKTIQLQNILILILSGAVVFSLSGKIFLKFLDKTTMRFFGP